MTEFFWILYLGSVQPNPGGRAISPNPGSRLPLAVRTRSSVRAALPGLGNSAGGIAFRTGLRLSRVRARMRDYHASAIPHLETINSVLAPQIQEMGLGDRVWDVEAGKRLD